MKNILFIPAVTVALFSCSSPPKEARQETEAIILSSESRTAHTVYLTKNQNQQSVICWTEEDTAAKRKYFFYSVSLDSGVSFTDKKEVPVEQEVKFHAEGMPKIAFRKNGDVYAFYEITTNSEFNRFAGEIHYVVSKDEGKSWSAPKRVHQDSTKHKGWSFLDVTTLSNGEIGACWLDTSYKKGGRPVKFAHTDSEGEFTNEIIVDSIACECCRTAIYCDRSGKISIVYRDIINDSIRDISVSTSTDDGRTFSKPVCFSGDNWNINGCPHNGPDVVSNGSDIYAVWFTGASEKGVYYAELNSNGAVSKKQRISSEGRYIQMSVLKDGRRVLVHNESVKDGDKYYSPIVAVLQPSGKQIKLTADKVEATLPVIQEMNGGFGSAWIQEGKVVFMRVPLYQIGNASI